MTAEVTEASELYGLPLDRFTKERDRLVRALRDDDRREDASAVAALRKPTIDAWALNQVARSHSEAVRALADSHRALREAADAGEMRRASETRNRLLDELLEEASAALESGGHSSTGQVRDRISRTLLAAASDPDVEESLLEGTLARSAEISGQWPGMSLPAAPPPSERTEGSLPEEGESERREEVERLEARARELAGRAGELRRAAHDSQEMLLRAREEAEAANRAARDAEREARKADEEAKRARRGLRAV